MQTCARGTVPGLTAVTTKHTGEPWKWAHDSFRAVVPLGRTWSLGWGTSAWRDQSGCSSPWQPSDILRPWPGASRDARTCQGRGSAPWPKHYHQPQVSPGAGWPCPTPPPRPVSVLPVPSEHGLRGVCLPTAPGPPTCHLLQFPACTLDRSSCPRLFN